MMKTISFFLISCSVFMTVSPLLLHNYQICPGCVSSKNYTTNDLEILRESLDVDSSSLSDAVNATDNLTEKVYCSDRYLIKERDPNLLDYINQIFSYIQEQSPDIELDNSTFKNLFSKIMEDSFTKSICSVRCEKHPEKDVTEELKDFTEKVLDDEDDIFNGIQDPLLKVVRGFNIEIKYKLLCIAF
ncbi:hypothetical protein ACFFRR_004050 [Megaselia abdita]